MLETPTKRQRQTRQPGDEVIDSLLTKEEEIQAENQEIVKEEDEETDKNMEDEKKPQDSPGDKEEGEISD